MTTPTLPNWHNPHNEDCQQNHDISQPCGCKREKIRKPYRTIKVIDKHVAHGLRPEIIMEIHPNGRLVLREAGRRTRYETTVGTVFSRIVWKDAMDKARGKKGRK